MIRNTNGTLPSTEGLLRLSLALSTTFRLNAVLTAEEHISRNQVTAAMEQEDIVALTAEECSPRLLELCLMHTRFPYPNGSNEYMIHLFEFHSLSSSARDNRNAKTTGKYGISKVFAILSDCQKNIVLSGRIYLDETYFSVMPKDQTKKHDGKHYRGLSRNKICVVTATDGVDVFLAVCGRAKPSRARILKAFEGHVKNGSVLIHDGENSHKILTEAFGLTEEVHTTRETQNLSDDDNPMEPINAVHRSLKRFMREHPAYDRDDLQDWLNLFWFIYTNRGIPMDDKVKKLLQMAILTHKVIRFREVFAKKSR